MPAIATSVFELFKCGPGPSSSHTLGPMLAGNEFRRAVTELAPEFAGQAAAVQVRLYGSLGATGRGHGTDRAVTAGLLGQRPESCPGDFLRALFPAPDARYPLDFGGLRLTFGQEDILFLDEHPSSPHSNTLEIVLLNTAGAPLLSREFYSLGGGFLDWKGAPRLADAAPAYEYESMAELKLVLQENGLQLHRLVLENETALTGRTEAAILNRLAVILATMEAAVERGLYTEGALPGIGLTRKAVRLRRQYAKQPDRPDSLLLALSAYAFAVSEENAAGNLVVTAPTCGSAGVIPSVLYALKHLFKTPERALLEAVLASSVVGFLVKHNASLAGAEVGCQGEVGVASAMAAAILAYANGYDFQTLECAAESALEHHLGLTCDPVGGLVQIPCIERNAMGAVKAYAAYLIAASVKPGLHKVGLDQAIRAMAETGRDMSAKYKETSQGGLALAVPHAHC